MKKLSFIMLAVLAACAQTLPGPIVMQNPKTGEVAQCSTANTYGEVLKTPTLLCARSYEKAGWVNLAADMAK